MWVNLLLLISILLSSFIIILHHHFHHVLSSFTVQKMKFSIKDFFSKCDQIRRKLIFTEEILDEKLHFLCSVCLVCQLHKGLWVKSLLRKIYQNTRFLWPITAQQMTFFIKDVFSKCDQIRRKLKKSLTENFIFCAVCISRYKDRIYDSVQMRNWVRKNTYSGIFYVMPVHQK